MIKPDPNIWRTAMGIAQATPEQCIYFDDRVMLARTAGKLGINAYYHQTFAETKSILDELTHTSLAKYEHQFNH
jgi:putative hydrolase of the HAD superfamily